MVLFSLSAVVQLYKLYDPGLRLSEGSTQARSSGAHQAALLPYQLVGVVMWRFTCRDNA
jgi:hypothetical protein